MAKVIIGPETGQVVKDGKIQRKDFIVWCQICLEKKIKNHQKLTKEDKEYVDSCQMKDWVTTDRDGHEGRGKTCPRCHQTIVLMEDGKWIEPKKMG